MGEKEIMEMFEKMFANFQEQVRLFMVLSVEYQKNNISLSTDILDSYKKNLTDMLNTLDNSLNSVKDDNMKNFYQPKIDYYYEYIDDLSKVYHGINTIAK